MEVISEYFSEHQDVLFKLIASVAIFFVLLIVRAMAVRIIKKRVPNAKRSYHARRISLYVFVLLVVLLIGPLWITGLGNLTTFLGLASAGLAIALHDTIANIAGWAFIISRRPFKLGDRIQIGDIAGDVIDMRVFQFSVIEIGNWVDAEQSTGRIIHIPNCKVLREPLANYEIGFDYIWHEVPILITFESDWKKAKEILGELAIEKTEHLSSGAQEQIRRAAEKYLIFYDKLSPIVYTTVKDSGVLLTMRYIVKPRQRRSTEQEIWEAVLEIFTPESGIELAYPTTRFYTP